MTTEPTNPIEPKPVEVKPARLPRSPQDKQQAKDIAAAGQTLRAALADADSAGLLAEGGYTPAELTRGLDLQIAAQAALAEHLAAEGAKDAANKAYLAAVKTLTAAYSKLRGLARSAFLKDTDALTTLGLSGREPRDLAGLLNAADALIRNSSIPAYTEKLARRAVTAPKLQDLQTKVAALQKADRLQEEAQSVAPKVTARRDQAAANLKAWLIEFKAFAKVQFKEQPDVLKSWGLKK